MKIQGANLVAKVPPFVKKKKSLLVFLIILIILIIAVYNFFIVVNETRITYFRTTINTEPSFLKVDSCSIRLDLDYSGNTHLSSEKPVYGFFIGLFPNKNLIKHGRHHNFKSPQIKSDKILLVVNNIVQSSLLSPDTDFSPPDKDKFVRNELLKNVPIFFEKTSRIKKHYYNYQGDLFESKSYSFFLDSINDNISYFPNPYFCSPTRITNKNFEKPNFFSRRNISDVILILEFDKSIKKYVKKLTINIDFRGAMNYNEIFPTPDYKSLTKITYTDEDKIDTIINEGLYLSAESLLTKNIQNNRNFILATLIGFLFSMIIDVIYRLFFKNDETAKDSINGQNNEVAKDSMNTKFNHYCSFIKKQNIRRKK